MAYEKERSGARKRGYSARWDKACATFKARHPHCLGCATIGRRSPTEVVDHVEPHKGDQAKFWNTALWQPACRWCHDVIKPELERRFEVGELTIADLWLNSPAALTLLKRRPPRQAIGTDGWLT